MCCFSACGTFGMVYSKQTLCLSHWFSDSMHGVNKRVGNDNTLALALQLSDTMSTESFVNCSRVLSGPKVQHITIFT